MIQSTSLEGRSMDTSDFSTQGYRIDESRQEATKGSAMRLQEFNI